MSFCRAGSLKTQVARGRIARGWRQPSVVGCWRLAIAGCWRFAIGTWRSNFGTPLCLLYLTYLTCLPNLHTLPTYLTYWCIFMVLFQVRPLKKTTSERLNCEKLQEVRGWRRPSVVGGWPSAASGDQRSASRSPVADRRSPVAGRGSLVAVVQDPHYAYLLTYLFTLFTYLLTLFTYLLYLLTLSLIHI